MRIRLFLKHNSAKEELQGLIVDVRLVFKIALEQNAVAIVLAHNHPSGKLQASEADIQVTKRIKNAGLQLDISVLDHIIVTEHSYFSFADEGIL